MSYAQFSTPSESSSSGFRNVSACNRCRLRKNRCDQRLPACSACEKAHVKCVGYDPITKREIPRSYVYSLESRVDYLEALLNDHHISYKPLEAYDATSKPPQDQLRVAGQSASRKPPHTATQQEDIGSASGADILEDFGKKIDDAERLNKMVSNIGMVSGQGASDSRYLVSTSGISFARVVMAAVKSSLSREGSLKGGVRPGTPPSESQSSNAFPHQSAISGIRDSFGLETKPSVKRAPMPDKALGLKLASAYFEQANPKIPILHQSEFMAMFNLVFAIDERSRSPRQLFMMFLVFAIGSGISREAAPEEFHASGILHLESFVNSPSDREDGFGGELEELQGILLLAAYALLRPVSPGLWYIVGVAVRLTVNLGLHYEDRHNAWFDETAPNEEQRAFHAKEKGRREWVRDLRRRLFWCTYSLDRVVGTAVARPFGIADEMITTGFPSILEDNFITTAGLLDTGDPASHVSYKRAAHHFFQLRLLQSEISQVLQYKQAQSILGDSIGTGIRQRGELRSPFLQRNQSFREWQRDVDRRLWEWKESSPSRAETGVALPDLSFELEYWQSIILLYRRGLTIPTGFDDGGLNNGSEEDGGYAENDGDLVFLKVAEASQKVLRFYRQLHRVGLVLYTYLDTHQIFMAAISFLYSLWHSPVVRGRLTLDDVDFTILASSSVLGDLIEQCPPAEACRDAVERMAKATVQMCLTTTGFLGNIQGLELPTQTQGHPEGPGGKEGKRSRASSSSSSSPRTRERRIPPQFDMNLRDLNPEEPTSAGVEAKDPITRTPLEPSSSLFGSNFLGLPGMDFMDDDWSDGNGLDLFDGFFFGATG